MWYKINVKIIMPNKYLIIHRYPIFYLPGLCHFSWMFRSSGWVIWRLYFTENCVGITLLFTLDCNFCPQWYFNTFHFLSYIFFCYSYNIYSLQIQTSVIFFSFIKGMHNIHPTLYIMRSCCSNQTIFSFFSKSKVPKYLVAIIGCLDCMVIISKIVISKLW